MPLPQATRSATKLATRFSSSIAATPPRVYRTEVPGLSRLPTKALIRSLLLTSLMSRSWILGPSLAALTKITDAKSAILDADRNPILNRLLRWTIYDQFCSGTDRKQVSRSMAEVKNMGFQGIILGYAKESIIDPEMGEVYSADGKYGPAAYKVLNEWKEGTLETLRMLEPGDFLALKVTGAGPMALDAMQARGPIPEPVLAALDEIFAECKKRGSPAWLDAEQQVLQVGLDEWAIDLERRYNRSGPPLVYTTIQGYLKGAKANAERHITTAAREGWSVGVKLVRGAYIAHEVRSLIHDTKEETDASYNAIADMFISQKLPKEAEAEGLKFPTAGLFLATHNFESAEKALSTHRERVSARLPTCKLECGQLFGMADELSCELLEKRNKAITESALDESQVPRILKCLCWGSVAQCVGFLHRRAVENRGAVERTHHMVAALKKELRRRIFG